MRLEESLLTNNSIIIGAKANSWQEAIKIGTDILVQHNIVEDRYYQAILDSRAKHGPYFILAPHLAMPHARPEDGVIKTGFALVLLAEPICFGDVDNDPIDIIITLATTGNKEHTDAIMQIVSLFEKAENFDKLRNCKTVAEVIEFIKQNSND